MTRLADVRRLLWSREGTTALEFALLALPYITLVLGIFEFSRAVWIQSAMQFAVERAARYAAMDEAACGTEKLQTYAASQMLAPGVLATSFSCTTPTCGYQVSVTTSLVLLLPYSLTLTARSCYPRSG